MMQIFITYLFGWLSVKIKDDGFILLFMQVNTADYDASNTEKFKHHCKSHICETTDFEHGQ